MSNKLPKISVIMCTYNRKDFLPRSIESILSQTFHDFEFIVVNNGSTDGSEEICQKYAKQDNRIKMLHIAENHGAPAGRNKGLDTASCEYITIVDDDDYCEQRMLEHLWKLASEYNADISMCGSWNDFGNRLEPYFIFDELLVLDKVQGLDELLKRQKYNVAPPTKLFRKSLFNEIRFIEDVLVDDIHVIYKVFANANIVVAQGTPLYHFRKHDGNMTGFIQTDELTPALLKEYLSMYKERVNYLSKKVPAITLRAKYSEWSYMISMCNKIKIYDYKECVDVYNYMVDNIKLNYSEIINCPFTTDTEKSLIREYVHGQA